MRVGNHSALASKSILASSKDLKRFQTPQCPHRLLRGFLADKILIPLWSGGKDQVWVQVQPLLVIWQSIPMVIFRRQSKVCSLTAKSMNSWEQVAKTQGIPESTAFAAGCCQAVPACWSKRATTQIWVRKSLETITGMALNHLQQNFSQHTRKWSSLRVPCTDLHWLDELWFSFSRF